MEKESNFVIEDLVDSLQMKGVFVGLSDNDLVLNAPKGALNEEMVNLIRQHKSALVDYISMNKAGAKDQPGSIPLVNEQPHYQLSSSQRRIWTMSQLEEANITFNIPGIYELQGDLRPFSLEYAFKQLIERHEILRTVFREDDGGEVRQFVIPAQEIGFILDRLDLRDDEQKEATIHHLIQSALTRPFDLSAGPLLRAGLYQVEDNKWILVFFLHHICTDGWSMNIFLRELMLFYEDHTRGKTHALLPLRVQYKDYAAWQQAQLQNAAFKEHKNYWLTKFEGAIPVLNHFGDKPRPLTRTHRGAIINKIISADRTAQLKILSQQHGCTLFMGLLAVIDVLLYRYTGQEDIIIGSPIAGREHTDLEEQVGFYVNTLALRTRFKEGDSFLDLLGNVRQLTLSGYEHQGYPFDELVEALGLKRDQSRNALFDVMILLQNMAQVEKSEINGLVSDIRISGYGRNAHVVSKYDLTFYFTEAGDVINTDIEYNSDIFNASTAVAIGDYLERLIGVILKEPGMSIGEIVSRSLVDNRDVDLPVVGEGERTGCTEHQKRLWFIDQFEKDYLYTGSPVYHNLPLAVRLAGLVDASRLESSVRAVVRSRDILRMQVVAEQSEPYQEVVGWEGELSVHHTGGVDEQEFLQSRVARPFRIGEEPLVRFDLINNAKREQVFLITAHHLVADRSTLRLILQDILSVYNGEALPLASIGYRQYSGWQNGLSALDREASLYYWKKKLLDAPVLYLDTDRPRAGVHIYEAALCSMTVPGALYKQVSSYCQGAGVDLYPFFLACFQVLLYRYTGSVEIVTGTFSDNRAGLWEGVRGPVSNLVTLRSRVDGDNYFEEVLGQVSADYAQSIQYGDLAFEKVVLEINPGKDMSRTALFDVLVHYEQAVELPWEELELNLGLGKYDLNLLVKQEQAGMGLYLTYNKKYFDSARMQRLLEHYLRIVESAAAGEQVAIGEYEYLGEEEKEHILSVLSTTDANYPTSETITTLFEQQVAATPRNIALIFGDRELDYAEVNSYANQLGHYLRERYGVKAGDLVGVQLARSEWLVIAILGIIKSGGAYVPIDPDYPPSRIEYIRTDSQCVVVIDEEELGRFRDDHDRYSSINPKHINQPGDLAYVIYTSGTTGNPKGSLVEHRNVVRLFFTDRPLFDFTSDDTWTLFHSCCFDFSVWEMYGALLYGGQLVILSSGMARDTSELLTLLVTKKVTVLNQTPSAFYNLLREEQEKATAELSLRYVIFGGEALSPGNLAVFHARYPGTRLINMYGITETTVHVTFKEIGEQEINDNSSNIGRAIPTLSCYVMDKRGHLLPLGVSGELYVGGAGVSRGYLNREELTKKRFVINPYKPGERLYRSGDRVKLLENGEMEYYGRIDEQVKIRGYRIELGEIENALRAYEGIKEVVVIAHTAQDGDKELVAYMVMGSASATLDVPTLRAWLQEQLPSYMVPAHYVQLDAMPLTVNGKIDRKKLPSPAAAAGSGPATYIAPQTATEIKIAAIWSELLERENISTTGNFFDLGGHSLKATRLASRLHKLFGVKIALKELFTHAVLSEQARLIDEQKYQQETYASIPPAPAADSYVLSAGQHRLWILSQFEQGSIAYNICGVYELQGELDRAALEKSFKAVVDRHEILRTIFIEDKHGELCQVITNENNFTLEWKAPPAGEPTETWIRKELAKDQTHRFDLAHGPLLKASIYQASDNKYLLSYVMHHITSDGWSMGILIKEILQAYAAFSQGNTPSLPPLRLQYKDYAHWQQEKLKTQEEHKNWWLQQLSGELPVLEWKGDKPRPAIKTYHGASLSLRIGSELSEGLKTLTRTSEATLFMGLLATVNTLLYRYSGQEDIIIGTPIAGREHADLEDQVGLYINTLALRTRFRGKDSFKDLLGQVKQVTLGAYEHQSYPFDELVESLHLQRDMSRSPLFDVWLVLHNATISNSADKKTLINQQQSNLNVKEFEWEDFTLTKFDLSFSFVETGQEIQMKMEYNLDIIDKQKATQLIDDFEQVLYCVTKHPNMSLDDTKSYVESARKEKQKESIQKIRMKNLANLRKY